MSTHLNSEDLRNISYALDHMSKTVKDTGVALNGYRDAEITYHDQVMRVVWQTPEQNDDSQGRYMLVMPDDQY